MSTTDGCPSDETLLSFTHGTLHGRALEILESHLDGCPHCRALLATVKGGRGGDGAQRPGWLVAAEEGTIAPGTLLAGRYRIVRLVGRGGMGEVYEAIDEALNTRVGVKTLTVTSMGQDQLRKRLRREVLMARQVTHANVCRIFDFGSTDELCFLTMEFLVGKTLRSHVHATGPLPVRDARPLVFQMTAGLQAAHDAGVIHRDFKSDNVILVEAGAGPPRAVITDFGLARSNSPDGVLSTLRGSFAGTFTHAAPEQLRGAEITAAADIFALGIVLFEIATGGKLPVNSANPAVIAQIRLSTRAPAPSAVAANVDARWDAIISRCLERHPSARPRSARDIFEALYPEREPDDTTTERRSGRRTTPYTSTPAAQRTTRPREVQVLETVLGYPPPSDGKPPRS